MRKVIDELFHMYVSEFSGRGCAYDGCKSLFALRPLPQNNFELTVHLEMEDLHRRFMHFILLMQAYNLPLSWMFNLFNLSSVGIISNYIKASIGYCFYPFGTRTLLAIACMGKQFSYRNMRVEDCRLLFIVHWKSILQKKRQNIVLSCKNVYHVEVDLYMFSIIKLIKAKWNPSRDNTILYALDKSLFVLR